MNANEQSAPLVDEGHVDMWKELYPETMQGSWEPRFPDLLSAWGHHVQTRPNAVAIWFFDVAMTYAEVETAAESLADALRHRGVGERDRVALYLQNDPQFVVATLAAWKLGAVPVAISAMLLGEELLHQLCDSGAVALICLDDLYDRVASKVLARSHVRTVVTTHALDLVPEARVSAGIHLDTPRDIPGKSLKTMLEEHAATARRSTPPRAADDVGFLAYTSGTTGEPKAAMNTHRALMHNSQVYADWCDLVPDRDVVMCVAPLFHITGIVAGMGVAFAAGTPIVLQHRFDLEALLHAIQERRVTFMVAASTVYVAVAAFPGLSSYDLSSLTKALSGGAPVSTTLVERVHAATGWNITGAYGMTETTSPTHLAPLAVPAPVDPSTGALAVGIPVHGCQVRIIDPATGFDLPEWQTGEIVVSGPMVIPGYWGGSHGFAEARHGGWLRTGDLGKQTEDGWLFVVDRLKDLINASGYKVYPREVEEVLQRHPAIHEAAVVGVPDDYRGENVKAVVSLKPGAATDGSELIAFCRDRLAAYKCPRIVEIVASLPRNSNGKILRRELRPA